MYQTLRNAAAGHWVPPAVPPENPGRGALLPVASGCDPGCQGGEPGEPLLRHGRKLGDGRGTFRVEPYHWVQHVDPP